jgi:NTE family protein
MRAARKNVPVAPASAAPTFALALGGGGARGLAHICVLEAFDELGVRPAAIAGTSIGAVIGAAYAAGIPAASLRQHVLAHTRRPAETMGRLLRARVGRVADLLRGKLANPALIDAEMFLDLFWPRKVPDRFEDLAVPFKAVATDLLTRAEVVFDSGPLAPAVAASMAIPGLIRPLATAGGLLIDGGAVNPLPYDLLKGRAERILAVDVTFGPVTDAKSAMQPFEAMFAAAQVMQGAVTAAKLRNHAPDVVIRPDVAAFRVLDFFKAPEIFARAEAVKDEVKRAVEQQARG